MLEAVGRLLEDHLCACERERARAREWSESADGAEDKACVKACVSERGDAGMRAGMRSTAAVTSALVTPDAWRLLYRAAKRAVPLSYAESAQALPQQPPQSRAS